jgi:hypothetical protein
MKLKNTYAFTCLHFHEQNHQNDSFLNEINGLLNFPCWKIRQAFIDHFMPDAKLTRHSKPRKSKHGCAQSPLGGHHRFLSG